MGPKSGLQSDQPTPVRTMPNPKKTNCGKLRHDTFKQAEEYCDTLKYKNMGTKLEKENHKLHAYKCYHCGFYHVGHWRDKP